jgi:hypothetical protein
MLKYVIQLQVQTDEGVVVQHHTREGLVPTLRLARKADSPVMVFEEATGRVIAHDMDEVDAIYAREAGKLTAEEQERLQEIVRATGKETERGRLVRAVALILTIDARPPYENPEVVELTPVARRQLREAIGLWGKPAPEKAYEPVLPMLTCHECRHQVPQPHTGDGVRGKAPCPNCGSDEVYI